MPKSSSSTPDADHTGQTILVTGASGGIGEEFARRFASLGADLVLVARSGDRLRELQGQLIDRHPGRNILVVELDLSLPGAGESLERALTHEAVTVDGLVNNAGVGSHGRFPGESPESIAAQIQLNCVALVDLTARFLPAMLQRGTGFVINVASTAAFQPLPTMAVYAASKAFVLSFSEALWAETRMSGVRVLALCPGATETAFFTRTGKEFLTTGRQTPGQVVDTALTALAGTRPTVVSGFVNLLGSVGSRFLPRHVVARASASVVRAK
jgi:short-subunit dehydrogenase